VARVVCPQIEWTCRCRLRPILTGRGCGAHREMQTIGEYTGMYSQPHDRRLRARDGKDDETMTTNNRTLMLR